MNEIGPLHSVKLCGGAYVFMLTNKRFKSDTCTPNYNIGIVDFWTGDDECYRQCGN